MNKEQYTLLKKAVIGLKKTHDIARTKQVYDFQSLNYYADIIESFEHFKDFQPVFNHIKNEVRE